MKLTINIKCLYLNTECVCVLLEFQSIKSFYSCDTLNLNNIFPFKVEVIHI